MYNERENITKKIIDAKRTKQVKWVEIAEAIGRSKEWVTSALLGQISLESGHIESLQKFLDLELSDTEKSVLMEIPYRGSLPTAVPTDPSFTDYTRLSWFTGAMKALIEEEFGDGIMSAIDFDMEITREPDPKGDRVRVNMTGKFLPYKSF